MEHVSLGQVLQNTLFLEQGEEKFRMWNVSISNYLNNYKKSMSQSLSRQVEVVHPMA